MRSVILVHPDFDGVWPHTADHFARLWKDQGPLEFIRLDHADRRPAGDVVSDPASVTRLVTLGVETTTACIEKLTSLREAAFSGYYGEGSKDAIAALEARGVTHYRHPTEGFWGQTVAEYGLALTLCGLRRIPQLHHAILTDLEPWDYSPPGGVGVSGRRGQQFGDDPNFTNGTIHGKRVRIVGAGNIASRYASFCSFLGAEVAVWDPYASEPCFHRAGSRKEWHLDRLVRDAEIFAPMVPLTESTRGVVTAAHIDALPKGCLVVLVTRAHICDVEALRRRVCNDELALAADVFDIEPVPLSDPLLGRHNVVHTPHNAGRTQLANERFGEKLAVEFLPV